MASWRAIPSRRVPAAPLDDHQPRQVRGDRQDDDGESVRAGDDQRAGEPGEARPADRDQPPAGRSARAQPEAEAKRLAQEGRAFYFVYGTIHSTEVGNTQSLIEIAHRLATDNSPDIKQILDNVVVLLVPSQNPDGQVPRRSITGTRRRARRSPAPIPDLYHKYVGHDDNRDWFMFTQKETRLAVEKIQNGFKPIITHDMHQMGATEARIFVPPFDDPYDPNVHPIIAQEIIDGRAGDGVGAGRRKARAASSGCRATTCGRRRGSTWSITGSRAS